MQVTTEMISSAVNNWIPLYRKYIYLIFLSQQVLYFLLSTLVLTLYIDVVLSLSISTLASGITVVSIFRVGCVHLRASCTIYYIYIDWNFLTSSLICIDVTLIGWPIYISKWSTLLASILNNDVLTNKITSTKRRDYIPLGVFLLT